jgi:aldose 1-epimerase
MVSSIAPSGRQWTIESDDHRAAVVEVGGGIRMYQYQGRDYLDGYGPEEIAPCTAGQILAPWPNRLGDGEYTFDDRRLAVPLNEPENHNAIHGLARWLPWHSDSTEPDEVELSCRAPAQPGYPWTLQLSTLWSVGPEGLTATHTATNLSDTPCPFGFGAHPYLQLPGVAVDDVTLTVPAYSRLEVDDRGLPTASVPVAATPYDYTTARPIGDAVLDTAFCDLIGEHGSSVELTDPDVTTGVRVWADAAFSYWQVFTADTLPGDRHRRAVAVEPTTCPPDAFRSGIDVVTLEPGESWQGSWGITPL